MMNIKTKLELTREDWEEVLAASQKSNKASELNIHVNNSIIGLAIQMISTFKAEKRKEEIIKGE